MEEYSFKIDATNTKKRIDLFLSEQINNISRSYAKKLLDQENVYVNHEPVKPNYKLKLNDVVNIKIPEPQKLEIAENESIELDILYEDDDLIVVNKPQGMVVHPAVGNYEGTLVNALLGHCGENLSQINGVIRPGIVHRIDKDTSGCLVVAKNNSSHLSLSEQIKEHSVKRKYIAIVYNNIKEDKGTIEAPIGRHPVNRKKMAVIEKGRSRSKNAVTHFDVLERFGEYTLIEAKLETGRTHQIRVHMSYIHHPVLGDLVYGPQKTKFNLEGQALHAQTLGFIHPSKKEYMEFKAPLPDYFEDLLHKLRNIKNNI